MNRDQGDSLLIIQEAMELTPAEGDSVYPIKCAKSRRKRPAIKTHSSSEQQDDFDVNAYCVMAHLMIENGNFKTAKTIIDQIPFDVTREFLLVALLLEMIWVGYAQEASTFVKSLDCDRVAAAISPYLK